MAFPVKEPVSEGNDSQVWNTGKFYSAGKIMMPLMEHDKDLKIAFSGVENIEDKPRYSYEMIVSNRLEALSRLVENLKSIYDNSWFIIKKEDQESFTNLYNRLINVEKCLEGAAKITNDARTKAEVLVINESHFSLCIKSIREIHREMLRPLNNASLIFPSSEEIDIDKLKREMIDGG